MIYIAIPDGWNFMKKDMAGVTKDILVNPVTKEELLLQDIVKECLRRKRRDALSSKMGDLTIYFSKPPRTENRFLQYEPNRNGKLPTEYARVIKGSDVVTVNPALYTTSGQRWFQHAPLSAERLEAVRERDKEVRDNRRHIGDNPKAT